MTEPTPDQLEHIRREHQIRESDPTVLTDADLEAMVYAHKDGCVRMAMAELLTARAELASLKQDIQQNYAAIAAKQQRDAARIAELEQQAKPFGHVVVAVVEGREPFIHGDHRHVMTAADAIRSVGRSDLPRGMTLKVCELREVSDRA